VGNSLDGFDILPGPIEEIYGVISSYREGYFDY
jgi:hypothetical protein